MEKKTIEELVEEYIANPSDELFEVIYERTCKMGWKRMNYLFNQYGTNQGDIEQLIRLATFRAIKTYNKLKSRFSTWVYYFYSDELFNYAMERRLIRKPDYVFQKKFREKLKSAHPEYYMEATSLDLPMKSDSDDSLLDGIADDRPTPDQVTDGIMMRKYLLELIEKLPPRQSKLMREYFGIDDGIPKTLQMLGDKYGVTRERIRQIIAKGIEKLRQKINRDDINL